MILYLHGFNSSPLSEKARLLAAYCAARGFFCAVPQLHHRPALAIAQAESLINDGNPHIIVGSSMGGYYATWLCEKYSNVRAVLINPAVRLAEKLSYCLNKMQTNYYNNETYLFNEEHQRELDGLAINKVRDPERYFLMVQTKDEILNYREAEDFYAGAQQLIVEGGDHSFVNFSDHLQSIIDFSGYEKAITI